MKYENNWESLNSRPVPSWFEDAKLGIFIHWGLYSVPAYAPFGDYAEWYGWPIGMDSEPVGRQQQYIDFHKARYGENFKYSDFVSGFTAENFNADEWAELFAKSGAKYMNLVSKHHDGFCLYKTDYAWNWNSVDVGPHRDFCAELKKACDEKGVRFGVYHSVYEWFHPTYLEDPEKYALGHLIPMLKEIVTRYEPATLFTDGEWSHPSSVWHSTEFLQWLYNESPVKDYIVPNDRWGKETRGHVGGNFTTEYGFVEGDRKPDNPDRVCEECRGIGSSFGWNRFERTEHYLSEKALIHMFIDLVGKGSNLLLNVGPTPDGRIPVIMQERLLQLGAWLDVNGEGIYGSRKYLPEASGEVRYTTKDGKVYAWLLRSPFKPVTLDMPYEPGVKVTMLGLESAEIGTENDSGKLRLVFPAIDPDDLPSRVAYGFRIEK